MLATTADRVRCNTDEEINQRIEDEIKFNIACYANASPEQIERRLAQLDREWDIERCVDTMAPTISLIGLALGITTSRRRWLLLPLVVQGFFLQHALQGWCPPIPLLRRLGIRTIDEINRERYALKALRGDFEGISRESAAPSDGRAAAAFAAVQR